MELPDSLEDCHALIRSLREENADLRSSGSAFGHLAERLNQALQKERRQRERRAERRAGQGRRADQASGNPQAGKFNP